MSTVTAAVAALLALSCACCIGYSMGAPLLRQTFVETHDSLLMPRFHIRTDGREGWLITNMTCSSAKTQLQLGACDSRDSQAFPGTCFQIMSKDIIVAPGTLNGPRVTCAVTTNMEEGSPKFPLLAFELIDNESYGPQQYASSWIKPGGAWVLLSKAIFNTTSSSPPGPASVEKFERYILDLSWPNAPINQYEITAIMQTFEVKTFVDS